MPKFHKKSYKKHKIPSKQTKKKIQKHVDPSKKTNLKFIQRGKDMVEQHRKQKDIEEKYRKEARNLILEQELETARNLLPEDEEDENPLEQLVAQLPKTSSSYGTNEDDEEEESGEEEEELNQMEDEDLEEETIEGEDMDDEALDEEDEGLEDEMDDMEADVEGLEEDDSEEVSDFEDNFTTNKDPKETLEKSKKLKTIEKDTANNISIFDAFAKHLDYELQSDQIEDLLASSKNKKTINLKWPCLKNLVLEKYFVRKVDKDLDKGQSLENSHPKSHSSLDLLNFGIKKSLVDHIEDALTPFQAEVLTVLGHYHDLYYPERSFDKAAELRQVYCLHLLNHMLKTRSRILNNSAKLAALAKNKKMSKNDLIIADNLRDQGLVRPKILVIVPVRDSAYRLVNLMIDMLFGKGLDKTKAKNQLMNYERFESEYTGNSLYFPKTNPKPEDYEQTFSGNTDDNFRVGITLTKKSLKLYTDFYASDIIIASPLAMRLVIAGSTEDSKKDYDFLNSIEMLIIDQADLLFAQNWENLLHVLDHLHLQPQSLRDTNFQRVREWYLSGLTKYYRQTLLFSSHDLPEFRALFNNKCCNYEGKVRIQNPIAIGNIRNIILPISQVFQRFNATSLSNMFDQRFEYFVQKILPRFQNPSYAHCMIYIPSYFDFVRIRNYFRKETINFVQICEYSEKGKIAKARDLFFHSGAHFLLYSERSHFFRRTRIKGIRHLIMYQPPSFPNFYSEIVNLMHEANQNKNDGLQDSMSITVLYAKYDLLQLSNIIGTENAFKLVNSSKSVHAFANE